jgi:Fe2+ transport system protein B
VDAVKLAGAIGVPVVPVDARSGKGVRELIRTLDDRLAHQETSFLAELPHDPIVSYMQIRSALLRTGVVARADKEDSITA